MQCFSTVRCHVEVSEVSLDRFLLYVYADVLFFLMKRPFDANELSVIDMQICLVHLHVVWGISLQRVGAAEPGYFGQPLLCVSQ